MDLVLRSFASCAVGLYLYTKSSKSPGRAVVSTISPDRGTDGHSSLSNDPLVKKPARPWPSPSHPFPADPPVEELQARLGLIQRHHMPTGVQSHKGEVPTALHLTDLGPLPQRGRVIGRERQIVQRDAAEGLLAGPFQAFGPGAVA